MSVVPLRYRAGGVASLFVAAAVVLAFPGRAAVKTASKVYGEPRTDQALVYLIRDARASGAARTMFVYADDKFLGTLDNSTYSFAYLAPGKHLLWLNWEKISTEVDLAAGSVSHFAVGDRFTEVDAESAVAYLEAADAYVTPDPQERETAVRQIHDSYAKARAVAAKRPQGMPGHSGSDRQLERRVAKWPKVGLATYSVLVIEDFTMGDPEAASRKRGYLVNTAARRLPDMVARNVGEGVFDEVRRDGAESPVGAVVLRVEITRYDPGSDKLQVLAGGGTSSLEVRARLVDGETGRELARFKAAENPTPGGPPDLAHGLGAMLGQASAGPRESGIEEIERNLAYEIALYLRRGKSAAAAKR